MGKKNEQHNHPFLITLILGLYVLIIGLYVFMDGKIAGMHNYFTNRIDIILALPSVERGLVSEGSIHLYITKSGKEILDNEQDLTKLLHTFYQEDPSLLPEIAITMVIKDLGSERIKEILSKYDLKIEHLRGLIVHFYGGVKHGSFLERKEYLKK